MRHPLDIEGKEERAEDVVRELSIVEEQLAARYNMSSRELRIKLINKLRTCEIYEDALIAKWLTLYSTALEYLE